MLITPVVLGSGTPMFKDIKDRIALRLLKATTWSSGIAALYYQPQSAGS
jgi:dihydrofolate reductase